MRKFYSNTSTILILVFLILGTGVYRFTKIPVALYPATSKPTVVVWLHPRDLGPLDFKRMWGESIESALKALDDVETVETEYQFGRVRFEVEFTWQVDPKEALENITNSVNYFTSQFPDDWQHPQIYHARGDGGFVFAAVSSEERSRVELSRLLDQRITSKINSIRGVEFGFVTSFHDNFVQITMEPNKLLLHGVNPSDIERALEANKNNVSVGKLETITGSNIQVRAILSSRTLTELEQTIIKSNKERVIRLNDVADVHLKQITPRRVFKGNGKSALIVGVKPDPEANIKQVGDEFLNLVEEEIAQVGPDLRLDILLNPSNFINEAVKNVIYAVLCGMGIASFIVFLFLGSLKNTLITAISMPLSLVAGFIVMETLGIQINLISLGAMALAVGMVVDGGVVVLENIVRHLKLAGPSSKQERLNTIITAVKEVYLPVIVSTLTTVIVFAPLPFTSPLASAILGDLARVMVCVLSISVLVTLLIIPSVAFFLNAEDKAYLKRPHIYLVPQVFHGQVDRLKQAYLRSLSLFLFRTKVRNTAALAVCAVFSIGAWLLLTKVDREIMAAPETDKIFLNVNFKDRSLDLAQTEALLAPIEQTILSEYQDSISHIVSQAREGNAWVLSSLKDKSQLDAIKARMEKQFKNSPTVRYHVSTWAPTSLKIPNPPDISVLISGNDETKKREIQATIEDVLDGDQFGQKNGKPDIYPNNQYQITIDDTQLEAMATRSQSPITRGELINLISFGLREKEVGDMALAGKNTQIKLGFDEGYLKTPQDIENLLIKTPEAVYPVRAFAKIQAKSDWKNYFSKDGQPYSIVEAWLTTDQKKDRKAIVPVVKAKILEELGENRGYITFKDTQREIDDNINSLVLALGISLVLIWIIVSFQFGGVGPTSIVMSAIPLGFIGVALSLFVFSSPLSINSMLGLILLAGTAVNNSIILCDFFFKIKTEENISHKDAALKAASIRFRPILITSLTTILGMLPIALGLGSGGKILQPLGIAVSGGLGISTLLTLFVVPVMLGYSDQVSFSCKRLFPKLAKTVAVSMLTLLQFTQPNKALGQQITKNLRYLESALISQDPRIKADQELVKKEQHSYTSNNLSLMPRLDFTRQFTQQDLSEDANAVNTLSLSMNINHDWFASSIVQAEKVRQAQLLLKKTRAEVLEDFRTRYFRAQMLWSLLENTKKNLAVAAKALSLAESKFKRGFISKTDFSRAKLQKLQLESSSKQSKLLMEAELEKLRIQMGESILAEEFKAKVLLTMPSGFAYFKWDSATLDKRITVKNSFATLQAKGRKSLAEAAAIQSQSPFLPNFGLTASWSDQGTSNVFSDDSPTITLGISWNLFSGLKDYYGLRANRSQVVIEDYKMSHTKRAQTQLALDARQRMVDLKNQAETQKQMVDSWQAIVEASQKAYKNGSLDAGRLYDDLSALYSAENKVLTISFDILSTAAELETITGEESLFYDLLGTI